MRKSTLPVLLGFLFLFCFSYNSVAQFTYMSGVSLSGISGGSAAWADYDNDGDLDIAISGGGLSKIYRNDGGGVFTEQTGIVLPALQNASVAWGDYNNDGYVDLLLAGSDYVSGRVCYTKLFKNNGNNTFTEQTSMDFTGIDFGSIAWGDYDNDGDLDLLITGTDIANQSITKVYRNTGNNSFVEQSGLGIPGLGNGSGTWGDLDNDGDLDIIILGNQSAIFRNNGDNSFTRVPGVNLNYGWAGSCSLGDYDNDGDLDILVSGGGYTSIYRNDGNFSFNELLTGTLDGAYYTSASWADYDNDGDLDIMVNGYTGNWIPFTKLYTNNGNNNFSVYVSAGLPAISQGAAKWADFDNDGDLDILMLGYDGSQVFTKLYRNDVVAKNTAPVAPTLPVAAVSGNNVTLSWKPVTTDNTSSNAMTYNLRVGTTAGGNQVLTPHSATNGYRRIPDLGNAQLSTDAMLRNLKKGTYYWSVQAVDNGFAGSPFSSEGSFIISSDLQASNLQALSISGSAMLMQWTRGTGSKCVVFAKAATNQVTAVPVNNTTYLPNVNFGSGTQLGTSGWYCVYNGTGDTLTIKNLLPATTYKIQVFEYTGAAGAEVYNTTTAPLNPAVKTTSLLTEISSVKLPGGNGDISWGDYDNDGDLDILQSGTGYTRIFRNDGTNVFTEQTSLNLPGSWGGSAAWGDYDSDGFLDIVLSTDDPYTKIFKNNGNNTFTEQTGIVLKGLRNSSFAWGDYDNDGDLDLLETGLDASNQAYSLIYRNNGNNTFLEQSGISLVGVDNGTVQWGDYDNDGDLDILLAGSSLAPKIYKNNGDNSFTEITTLGNLYGWGNSAAWGDYDNDGDLDFIFLGGYPSKLYRNDGNDVFTEQTAIPLAELHYGLPAFADYDNDGDLDLLLSGYDNQGIRYSKLYMNNGDNSFTEQTGIILPAYSECSISWGDADKDGDLDLLMMGYDGSGNSTRFLRNDIQTKNTAPAAPTGISTVVNGNDVVLKWKPVTGDLTPKISMLYNVRVGKTSGAVNVTSPNSSSLGYHRIVNFGNAQLDTTYVLKSLKKGSYYWAVQAIDNGFTGGAFSIEGSFTITTDAQASNIQVQKTTGSTLLLQWTRGTGANCIVFVKAASSGTASPVDNATYTANSVFSLGTQIGATGWYCVAKGTQDTVTIKGLQPLKDYSVQVFEYNGSAGSESYFTNSGMGNPIVRQTPLFSEVQGNNFFAEGAKFDLGDFDGDGDLDILAGSRIYINNGNLNFSELTPTGFRSINWGGISSWFDYDRDGDLDVLISGQYYTGSSWQNGAFIYRNDGAGVFSEQTAFNLKGGMYGSVAWGDYDNDGDYDLLLSGYDVNWVPMIAFYENNAGTSFTEKTNTGLPGLSYGSLAWADYNNDGFQDIIMTGNSNNGYVTRIYKNNGNGTFSVEANANLVQAGSSVVSCADYNNDGYIDILLAGESPNGKIAKLYKNNGNGSFSDMTSVVLTAVGNPNASWGDFDNDGDLDLFLSGMDVKNNYVSAVYRNNGDNTFTAMTNISMAGASQGNAMWADFDNDNDLDFFMCGNTSTNWTIKLYRNEMLTPKNAVPAAPSGLASVVNNSLVTLMWNPVKTDETPYKGMTYNVRIASTTPNGVNIVAPHSNPSTGVRLLSSMGNAQLDTMFSINLIKKGTYYWSVQAVDNGYQGSTFASEKTFSITANIQAANIYVTSGTAYTSSLKWTRGNGDYCIVFVKQASTGTAIPVDNTTYTANTSFGSGTEIGASGWYCVYNGTADTVSVSNLSGDTPYTYQVFEYDGIAGSESYYSTSGNGNPIYTRSSLYAAKSVAAFMALKNSDAAFADYDNDGDLDLVMMGRDNSNIPQLRLYKNNGSFNFSEQVGAFSSGIADGSLAWGDYNNDGYADLIVCGKNAGGTGVTKIYKNNSGTGFTEQTGIVITGLYNSSVAWGDYDNDGDFDILISGLDNSSKPTTKVFQNKGYNAFMEQVGIILPGLSNGSVAWGDYDNDDDLDILISGTDGTTPVTKIFRNNGNNSFTDQLGISLPGTSNGTAIWGDYNQDGYLDICVTGRDNYSALNAKIFRNNKDNTFALMNNFKIDGCENSNGVWGDYDNDGDLDLAIAGLAGSARFTRIFRNDGDTAFTALTDVQFLPIEQGVVLWADVDNDKDQDLLISGFNGSVPSISAYINETKTKNTAPAAPVSLSSTVGQTEVDLKWNGSGTDETKRKGLTYNVRIGRIPGALDVVSPHSATDGYRRLNSYGNAMEDSSFVLKNLPRGPYYWSVQAVDNGMAGGPFSNEQQFLVTSFTQASNVQFLNPSGTSMLLQWSRGNGQKCVVFGKAASEGNAIPEANTTYHSNPVFGSGSQIGSSGWYCVYNGDKDTVTVKGLVPSSSYVFQVFEYEGSAGIEFYFPGSGQGNPAVKKVSVLTEQTSFAGNNTLYGGVWGDYDNDGDQDFLAPGYPNSRIYRNDGNNIFTEQTGIAIKGVRYSSAAWGDYNNDGYLDFIISGYMISGTPTGYTGIYKNNGNGTFTEQSGIVMKGVFYSSVDWGDYDNDGDLDVLISGRDYSSNLFTLVYRNNGDNSFSEQTSLGLRGISQGSARWMDYNQDGLLDILLAGNNGTQLYRNEGDGLFTLETAGTLPPLISCSVDIGDYDGDGDLDFIAAGRRIVSGSTVFTTSLFRNMGHGIFSEQTNIPFAGVYLPAVSFADYDNDGDLDILVAGRMIDNTFTSRIYQNMGNNVFSERTEITLPGIYLGTARWADYDGDGDLDVLIAGSGTNGITLKLFKNNSAVKNMQPLAPSGLNASSSGENVILNWNSTNKDETLNKSLSYNMRIGRSPGASDVMAPQSSPAGIQRLYSIGNAQLDTSYILSRLRKGTYYWTVQAVDNGFLRSPFASENSFTVTNSVQSSNILVAKSSARTMALKWTRGNGDYCVVFAKDSTGGSVTPLNNQTYSASSVFGNGTEIGSGWYCIYNGTRDTITVSGLEPLTNYIFQVYDYDGNPGTENYYTSTGASNPASYKTSQFLEQTGITLDNLRYSNVAWGDYDNDGDLDILIAGLNSQSMAVSKVYRNNGDNTFSEQTGIILEGVYYAVAEWFDYDNDGDLDILLAGYTNSTAATWLYRNNGDNTFTLRSDVTLPTIVSGTISWGDYNNDGYKDILFCGTDYSGNPLTQLYRNNGDYTFANQGELEFTAVTGFGAWGDYDKDGYPDILVSGNTATDYTTILYHNNGNNSFTPVDNLPFSSKGGLVKWFDFDEDGDLDIFLVGNSLTDGYETNIYRNDGNDHFSLVTNSNFMGLASPSASIADGDGDGDMDILLCGSTVEGLISTIIYWNNGDGTFTEQNNGELPGIRNGGIQWGDYDNDGDLDVALSGSSPSGLLTRIFSNETNIADTPPDIPANPVATVTNNSVMFRWNRVHTDATAPGSISYNLRIGSVTQGTNALAPHSSPNGYLKVPSIGSLQLDTIYQINELKKGTYYWSVQAVDNGMEGGAFSNEQTFTISSDFQASKIQQLEQSSRTMDIQWIRGTGDACLVFMRMGTNGTASPDQNVTYTPNPVFGLGSQIGTSGWYCVYKGKRTSCHVEGLEPFTDYIIQVYEFSGAAGSENYLQLTGEGNPYSVTSGEFGELDGLSIMGVQYGTMTWADYNNDGNMDFFISGLDTTSNPYSKLYRNMGDSTFVPQDNINIEAMYYSCSAWADYDLDGDLDLLVSGRRYTSPNVVTKLYRNNGDNTFTEQTEVALPGVYYGAIAWGDYDNDGDPDIAIAGNSVTGARITKIFRNDGSNVFTEQTGISLTGVAYCSLAWGDYDNDGDLDLVISGNTGSTMLTSLYRNDGQNKFTEITSAGFAPVYYSSVAWGDYDADGLPDLLLTGYGSSGIGVTTRVYHNDGNDMFTDVFGATLPSNAFGSGIWGDYDNDGLLDILAVGNGSSRILHNNGNNSFTEKKTITIDGVDAAVGSWVDIDNDGDLDFSITGIGINGTNISEIYRNDRPSVNNAPSAPTGLTTEINGGNLTFSWNPVSGDETPASGMNYNLQVGSQDGQSIYLASNSSSEGFHRLISTGNGQQSNSWQLNLPKGNYFWQVQAIDNAYRGGAWSEQSQFSVTKLTPVIYWDNPDDISVGTALSGSQLNASANVPGSFSYTPAAGTLLNGGTAQPLSVSFVPADTNNYVAVEGQANINVLKVAQVISFGELSQKTYGSSDFNPGAGSSSGLTVSYSSSDPAVASIVNNKIHLTGIGHTTITASQSGNQKYDVADDVSQDLEVVKADQSITFNLPASVGYGSSDFGPASANSGLAVTYQSGDETVATIVGGKIHPVGVGTAVITASQAGNAYFNAATDVSRTLTVVKGDQSISFSVFGTKSYGDQDFTAPALASSGLPIVYTVSNPNVVVINNGIIHITGTGLTTITAHQDGNNLFKMADSVSRDLKVIKGNQSLAFPIMQPRSFGETDFDAGAYTSSGLPIVYSSSNPVVATIVNGKVHLLTAWITEITASQPGDDNYNPAVSITRTLIVNKADQLINFPPIPDKGIGASDFSPGATASSGLAVSYYSSDPSVAIVVNGKIRALSAGTTDITASQAGNGNYNPAPDVIQTFKVNITGITDLLKYGIKIYPVPAHNFLYVESGKTLKMVELIDMLGKSVKVTNITREKTEINVNSLPKGIYFMRLTGEGIRTQVKILIE